MKIATFAILVAVLACSAFAQDGFGPCPNDPRLLQPYCFTSPDVPQFHTVPIQPPQYNPEPDNSIRDLQRFARSQQCKMTCQTNPNFDYWQREACKNNCE